MVPWYDSSFPWTLAAFELSSSSLCLAKAIGRKAGGRDQPSGFIPYHGTSTCKPSPSTDVAHPRLEPSGAPAVPRPRRVWRKIDRSTASFALNSLQRESCKFKQETGNNARTACHQRTCRSWRVEFISSFSYYSSFTTNVSLLLNFNEPPRGDVHAHGHMLVSHHGHLYESDLHGMPAS